MKLDGDIELAPGYLRDLMERFAADSRLGLAGGVLDEPRRRGGVRRLRIARNHVHGALKCYSRRAFARRELRARIVHALRAPLRNEDTQATRADRVDLDASGPDAVRW